MTPEQKVLRSRMGGYALMAKHGPDAVAAKARKGFRESFESKVDPNNELPEAERKARAEMAFKLHMSQLSAKAAAARARKKQAS